MSTDAARTKLRELIAVKQQWLRQWQAPELLSPGQSDMVHILSDNIAELQQVLAELDKAEPQEPDSPERRCGGPGCDGACCQPVQEPITTLYGTLPIYDTTPEAAQPMQERNNAPVKLPVPHEWHTELATTCFARGYSGEGSYYCPHCDINVGSVWREYAWRPTKWQAICHKCRELFEEQA